MCFLANFSDPVGEADLVARERQDAAAGSPTSAGFPGQAEADLPRDGRRQEGERVSCSFIGSFRGIGKIANCRFPT